MYCSLFWGSLFLETPIFRVYGPLVAISMAAQILYCYSGCLQCGAKLGSWVPGRLSPSIECSQPGILLCLCLSFKILWNRRPSGGVSGPSQTIVGILAAACLMGVCRA